MYIPSYDRIDIAHRPVSGIYHAYTVGVLECGFPSLHGWDVGLEDYERYYLNEETVKVFFDERTFMRQMLAMSAWRREHFCLSVTCESFYYHVGDALNALLKKGIKFAFLRGSEVSLDRLVQL